ncbi:DnaJ homolog subfamily C member 9 [Durusdinium trenchii]|uniref:DnaJ homolog subfamily C member 9 n=1 Tax=Durusdinium trenchii TaxID=1381693 RepID=A0ABP0P2X7_9DINO
MEKEEVDLYGLLRVTRGASKQEVRKAYLRLALVVHPDKRPGDENAARDFGKLQEAYAVLSDPVKRRRYDRTGCVDADGAGTSGFWEAYERYRGVEVSTQDIDDYVAKYKGSAEEEADLRAFFRNHNGDISNLLAFIPGSGNDDVARFKTFFAKAFPEQAEATSKQVVKTVEELDKEQDLQGEEAEDGEDDEDAEEEEDDDDQDDLDGFIVHEDDGDDSNDDEMDKVDDGPAFLPVGTRVRAKWRRGAQFYDAVITKANKRAKTFDVKYDDDGTTEKGLPRDMLRPVGPVVAPAPAPAPPPAKKKRRKQNSDDGLDALRAAMAAKGAQRRDNFAAFEAKWSAG